MFAKLMKDFMASVQVLRLTETQYAILCVMVLMSPDRGSSICTRDRQQLNRLQEIFAHILRLEVEEMNIVGQNPVRFAKYLNVLTKLRSISASFSTKFNTLITNSAP